MSKRQVAPSTGIRSIKHGTSQRKHVCEEASLRGLGPGSGFRKPAQTGAKGKTGLAVRGGCGLPHVGPIYSIAFLKNKLHPQEPWGQPAASGHSDYERSLRHQPAWL